MSLLRSRIRGSMAGEHVRSCTIGSVTLVDHRRRMRRARGFAGRKRQRAARALAGPGRVVAARMASTTVCSALARQMLFNLALLPGPPLPRPMP